MAIHVSRQHIEVLGYDPFILHVSKQHIEVLGKESPNLHVSRQHIEVLGYDPFILHVSRQHVEVLGKGPPNLHVSRQHIEILTSTVIKLFATSDINFQQVITFVPLRFINQEYYGTIHEADEYFSKRLHERAWSKAKAIDRKKALWATTLIIDALNFKGHKHSVYEVLQEGNTVIRTAEASQVLEFPRDADTEVPEEIRLAVYEIAQSLLDGKDPELELETLGIISQGVASTRTSYNRNQVPIEHIINGVPSTQAWRLLRPFLREDDVIILSRIT